MSTTKFKIAEQVERLMGGQPVTNSKVNKDDIMLLIGQACNKVLKADHFSINMPEGDTIPNNCMIIPFDDVAVTTYKTTKSRAELPFIPISLPRNVGVLHISKTDEIDNPFIPIPTAMYGIISPQRLFGEMSELIGYEVKGKYVEFTQDLPGLGINTVYMLLVGVDFSTLSIYDPIPLSADMETDVVQEVYKLLTTVQPSDRATDSNAQ